MSIRMPVIAARSAFTALQTVALAVLCAGCVSSTLDADQFRPVGDRQATSQSPLSSQVPQPQDGVPEALVADGDQPPQAGVSGNSPAGDVSDPARRQQAIDEMRAKAAASSGEKTQIGAVPQSAARQMTAEEQSAISEDLESRRQATGSELPDAEIEARRAAILRLQKKGKTHYDSTVNTIED